MDGFKGNSDKLLLGVLFLVVLSAIGLSIRLHATDATVNWFQNVAGQILAALLTLMVSRSAQRRGDSPNDNATTSATLPPKSEGVNQ